MRAITLKIAAGQSEDVAVSGDYVRVKTAGVSVRIEAGLGAVDATVEQGDALNLKPFESLMVSHASGVEQTITLMIGNGTSADSSKVGGSIAVTSMPEVSVIDKGAILGSDVLSVVGVASVFVLAARAGRRSMFLQNMGSTIIHVRVGSVAAPNYGIRLNPGDSYSQDRSVAPHTVFAISDAAGGLVSAWDAY